MKTERERDMIDYPIALRKTKTRARKLVILREFKEKHGDLPERLIDAFGQSEWERGWSAGATDATEGI